MPDLRIGQGFYNCWYAAIKPVVNPALTTTSSSEQKV